jgi:hypothetical protein
MFHATSWGGEPTLTFLAPDRHRQAALACRHEDRVAAAHQILTAFARLDGKDVGDAIAVTPELA